MTAVELAAVPDTAGDVVDKLLTALRAAYLDNDGEGVETFARQILVELGDNPVTQRPKTTATARLFLGWAMMNKALHRPRDLDLLGKGMDEITSVLHVLLERDDMVVERVTAEAYLAFGALVLGDVEACDGKMLLLKGFVDVANNIDATTMYLRMSIIIRRFNGEDIALPELPARVPAVTEAPAEATPVADDEPVIYELDASHQRQIADALKADDPNRMIELVSPLIDQDPARLTAKAWFTIEHAHVWAWLRIAFTTTTADERRMLFEHVLPYTQRLVETAQAQGQMRIFIRVGLDLAFMLHSMGRRQEVEPLWVEICRAVHESQDPEYREHLRATQDQIAELYSATGSRPIAAT